MSATRLAAVAALVLAASLARCDPVTFTGTVLGPDGRPVVGAVVMARDAPAEGPSRLVETTTDAGGRFDLKLEMAYVGSAVAILAMHPSLALGMQYAMPGLPVAIRLGADPVVFAVKTVDAEGSPVAGAAAHVVSVAANSDTAIMPFFFLDAGPLDGVTDAEGLLRFSGLPAEARLSLNIAAEGLASVAVQLAEDTGTELTVTMVPEGRISGRVLHDGQPVADVEVRASRERDDSGRWFGNDTTRTGPDGAYTLRHLPAGNYSVRVSGVKGLVALPLRQVPVQSGVETAGQDLQLSPGALVRGKVRDASTGEPAAGMWVWGGASDWPSSQITTKSAADGSYELRLAPGTHEVSVRAQRMYSLPEGQERSLELAEGDVVEGVDFVVQPPAAVTGVVLTPEGRPATGVIVWFAYLKEYGGRPHTWAAVQPSGAFRLDTTESFIEQGGYVIARDPVRDLIAVAPFGKSQRVLEMALQPAAYVWCTAQTPEGEPLEGISFSAYVKGKQRFPFMVLSGETDAQGIARLGPLPPRVDGDLTASRDCWDYAVGDGWWSHGVALNLQPGQQLRMPPAVLDLAGRSLEVTVKDTEDRPMGGAEVYVCGLVAPVLTNEAGNAVLSHLPLRGTVTVIAADATRPLFAASTVDPDATPAVTLVLRPPVSVNVTIQRRSGEALADSEWQVWLPELVMHQGSPEFRALERRLLPHTLVDAKFTADAQGRFALQGLVAGLPYGVRGGPKGSGLLSLDPLVPGSQPNQEVVLTYPR